MSNLGGRQRALRFILSNGTADPMQGLRADGKVKVFRIRWCPLFCIFTNAEVVHI